MRNKTGFTLIEVLVAMVITLVGLLGLLASVETAMEHNVRNQLRDEATLIAEQWMGNLKTRGFSQITTATYGVPGSGFPSRTVKSQLRGSNFVYIVDRPCYLVGDGTSAQLTVTVTWYYKGSKYTHSVSSIRSNQ